MIKTISCYILLCQIDVASRLTAVFFPDQYAPDAKCVQLELSEREEDINEMLCLAQTSNNEEKRSHILQLVYNIKLKKVSNYKKFKETTDNFIGTAKSY